MFLPRIKPGENPPFEVRRFPIRNPAHYRYNEIPLRCRKFEREGAPRHANGRGNKARGTILVISYLNLNTGRSSVRRRRLNAGRHYGLCLPACLPCNAITGPETSNNSLSIAPHTVAARVGCTDDFLPALGALLLPGTALSTLPST